MNADRLLEHFERISDAADAVPRLRRFVLDLATRGRLVEQDSRDEPASALASHLRAAVAQTFVTSGQPRKAHNLPSIGVEDAPFILPASWTWVAIREVTTDRGQTSPSSHFTYIDVTAINKELGVVSDPRVLSANEAPSRARKRVQAGDVIYSCVRPTLLNVAVIDQESDPPAIASTAFAVINAHGGILPRYLWTVLRSPFFVECVDSRTRGQAYPAINDGDFALLPLPLPPLAEQHRIVAKVDELMALCDRLEAAQTEREARRDRLVSASLARVTEPDSDDATSTTTSTRFHLDHFARLTMRPEHVKQLRQAILNLAVRGRLACDEVGQFASHASSRESALRESRLPVTVSPIGDSAAVTDVRDNFPATWHLSTLQDVASITQGFAFPSESFSKTKSQGMPLIRIGDIGSSAPEIFVPPPYDDRYLVRSGDLLMGLSGSIKCARWNGPTALLNQRIACIRPLHALCDSRWLEICIDRQLAQVVAETSQLTVKNVRAAQVRELPVPLPPLAEQHRIVAKVDELMALCDQLEASLASAATDRARLLEALLHEALEPAA